MSIFKDLLDPDVTCKTAKTLLSNLGRILVDESWNTETKYNQKKVIDLTIAFKETQEMLLRHYKTCEICQTMAFYHALLK